MLSIQDRLLQTQLQLQLANQAINPLVLAAVLILVLVLPAPMTEAKIDQGQDPKTAIVFNIGNLNISASPAIKKVIFCEIALTLKPSENTARVSKINNNNKSLRGLLAMLIGIRTNRVLPAISGAVTTRVLPAISGVVMTRVLPAILVQWIRVLPAFSGAVSIRVLPAFSGAVMNIYRTLLGTPG